MYSFAQELQEYKKKVKRSYDFICTMCSEDSTNGGLPPLYFKHCQHQVYMDHSICLKCALQAYTITHFGVKSFLSQCAKQAPIRRQLEDTNKDHLSMFKKLFVTFSDTPTFRMVFKI